MYVISRVAHYSLAPQKYIWHPGGKSAGGNWSRICNGKRGLSHIPVICYYEAKHAKAVMTRYGWRDSGFYTYAIEKV